MTLKTIKHNIMVDLETLSTAHNAAILTIGAVEFGLPHGFANKCKFFYDKVIPESIDTKLFDIDKTTLTWWDKQPSTVRVEAFSGTKHIEDVLISFNNWLRNNFVRTDATVKSEVLLWSKGADFDCKILASAMETYGIDFAVDFRNYRCARTVMEMMPKALLKLIPPNDYFRHNALADAQYQAKVIDVALNNINWNK